MQLEDICFVNSTSRRWGCHLLPYALILKWKPSTSRYNVKDLIRQDCGHVEKYCSGLLWYLVVYKSKFTIIEIESKMTFREKANSKWWENHQKSNIRDNSLIILSLEINDSLAEGRCPFPVPPPTFQPFTERLQVVPEMNDLACIIGSRT